MVKDTLQEKNNKRFSSGCIAARRRGAGERRPVRAGYMGHVTALANKLGEVGTRRPAVTEALRGSRAWAAWLQRVLRPRNELENVMRWACGRPSPADLAGADSDEAELAVRGRRAGLPGSGLASLPRIA